MSVSLPVPLPVSVSRPLWQQLQSLVVGGIQWVGGSVGGSPGAQQCQRLVEVGAPLLSLLLSISGEQMPHRGSASVGHDYQRLLVRVLCRSLAFQQHCVETGADVAWCCGHLLGAARVQVDAAHWCLALLIVRILPVVKHRAVQIAPASMPGPKAGDVLEHGEEALVFHAHRQFAVNLHVNNSFERAYAQHLSQRPASALNLPQRENGKAVLHQLRSSHDMRTRRTLHRWHDQSVLATLLFRCLHTALFVQVNVVLQLVGQLITLGQHSVDFQGNL